ncbi:hypothetical protein [Mongoliitalea daihaiensis]|uniref:hypothetical protein n=1 Tax=Mongoliitalea daihaiensis TaxID=2782006 RepID=UPI001F47D5BB|nr:hypothetical protein [Mongoliitalea daihaiensis]UJP66513.1 hypothetical protein IPZ59_07915 [Mongoliitalea daihaiensis]
MFKTVKVLGVCLLLSFGWCFQVEAQEVIPEIGGFVEKEVGCRNNEEIKVKRCEWVIYESACDPSIQDLC